MYVDNLIKGANSEEEAKRLYVEAKQKVLEISMNLRDWKSSSKNLNKTFSVNDRWMELPSKYLDYNGTLTQTS